MNFTLVDKQDRNKMGEGRSHGFGSGFAKLDGSKIVTVMPVTACKDFLNDAVYSEVTGKPYSAHGFNTTKLGIFEKTDKAYLVFGILKYRGHTDEYNGYKEEVAKLESNWKNVQKFLNIFEELFKIEGRTEVHRLEDNRFVAIMPLFWINGTYRISLYSLLMRAAVDYKDGDVMDFLASLDNHPDVYQIKGAIPKIQRMIEGVIPEQNMNIYFGVHNCGIVGYSGFPVEPTYN